MRNVRKKSVASEGLAHARVVTQLIHGVAHTRRWEYNHHVVPPMTASATFRLDSAERGSAGFEEFDEDTIDPKTHRPIYIYDRLDEPTCGMLEDNLAVAEGGEVAVCFASGMAGISAAFGILLQNGEHIVGHNMLYGCTYSLITRCLPKLGISHTLVDFLDLEELFFAIRPDTRVVYFETPVNPDLKLIDIRAVVNLIGEVNRKRGEDDRVHVVVDNTFASPYCQRPLQLGADLVCQSLTKAIGGFGTDMGGAVISAKRFHRDLILHRKDFGACLSPKCAWPVLVQGLPTLSTRMVRHQESAMEIALFLESHPKISKVSYPGLNSFPQHKLAREQMTDYDGRFAPGSMVYFELEDHEGSGQRAARFIDLVARKAYSLTLAVSLGQIKTLIESPFCMTHAVMSSEQKERAGLSPSGVRLSVGLEEPRDIIADLQVALEHV